MFINPKGSDMGAVPLNLGPSAKYPLGTDGLGRDMFAVMVIGIPNTFKIGFLAGAVGVAHRRAHRPVRGLLPRRRRTRSSAASRT